MKYYWMLVALYFAFFATVACNQNNFSAQNSTAACPNGGVLIGTVCTANGPGVPLGSSRVGFFTQSANFPIQYTDAAGTSMNFGAGFPFLLANAEGVCNRQAYSGGLAACDPTFTSNGFHDMVIILDSATSNSAMIIVRSYATLDPSMYYSYSFPSVSQFFAGLFGLNTTNQTPVYDPLVLNATVWPVNNSQGFELRANGPTYSNAWWSLIQFQVPTGSLTNNSINFNMLIDNGSGSMVQAISGTMNKCQTYNCGIPGL